MTRRVVEDAIGNSLSLDETLSVLSVRLKRLIPYDSIAIYCKKDDRLVPEFVTGDNFRRPVFVSNVARAADYEIKFPCC